ncbi:MAG: IS66 family insertion sequence element accessory protein TnpA [Myxococcota bacterium]
MNEDTKQKTSRRKRLDRDEWRKLIAEYEASGETQADFAKKHGIGLSALRSWLYRFRQEAEDEATGAESLDDLLVAAAGRHGYLKTGMVADALDVSSATARRYLKWLVEEGRLRRVGKKRGTRYFPAD